MDPDELKRAWHSLELQLEAGNALQLEILRERKLDRVRRQLRPLLWWQVAQMVLGIALIVLGVACWTRNTDVPGLLISGLLVHAFGVLTTAMAGLTIALAGTIDYAAPVLEIQKRLARLLAFYRRNAALCGWPWWIMWLLVVVAIAGLGEVDAAAGTPAWIAGSLGIGAAGLLGTWAWTWSRRRRVNVNAGEPNCASGDGSGGIRRGQQLLDEIARFERD